MGEAKRRVLLVDDELNFMHVISKRLEVAGFEVLMARDGDEAVTKARAEHPDVIVLDLVMARVSGFEACRMLRQEQAFRQTPIIFYSGKYGGMEADALKKWGANAFVSKTDGSAALIAMIGQLLGRKD